MSGCVSGYEPPPAWGDVSGPCPGSTCEAQPGQPCITSTGIIRREPHALRWLAAQSAVVKCECGTGCERCHRTTFRLPDAGSAGAGAAPTVTA